MSFSHKVYYSHYISISAPLGNKTNYRVDFTTPDGRPATNKKPKDKINIDTNRKIQSRSNYRLVATLLRTKNFDNLFKISKVY